jgi:hypothetical protein
MLVLALQLSRGVEARARAAARDVQTTVAAETASRDSALTTEQ